MAKLEAEVTQMVARLEMATRTLEINRNNLERQLRHSQANWQLEQRYPATVKHHWQLTWQTGLDQPLIDQFNLNIRLLQNHLTYLQGGLTYLAGLRKRWELQLEERRLEIGEKIGVLGHILILMVALGEVIKLTQESQAEGKDIGHGSSCWQWLTESLFTCEQQTLFWKTASQMLLGANTYLVLLFVLLVLPTFYFLTRFLLKKLYCLIITLYLWASKFLLKRL